MDRLRAGTWNLDFGFYELNISQNLKCMSLKGKFNNDFLIFFLIFDKDSFPSVCRILYNHKITKQLAKTNLRKTFL